MGNVLPQIEEQMLPRDEYSYGMRWSITNVGRNVSFSAWTAAASIRTAASCLARGGRLPQV